MEISSLTISDLRAALADGALWGDPVLPISRQRAFSQVHNPRAEEHDQVLFVMRHEGSLVGYFGLLPDLLQVGDLNTPFAWVSTWWVDPERVQGGAGALLLMKALAAWQGRVAAAGFQDRAGDVLAGCGRFTPIAAQPGITAYLRFDGEVIRRRVPGVRHFGPLADAVATGLNRGQDHRVAAWLRRSAPMAVEYVRSIDQQTARFIEAYDSPEPARRGPAELEWILQRPWVLEAPLADGSGERYYFSSTARRVQTYGVRVLDGDGQLAAFLILVLRDRELKVPFAIFPAAHGAAIAQVIIAHLARTGAERVTTFQADLVRELGCGEMPLLATRPARRLWTFSKTLAESLDMADIQLQDGAGDGAFT